MAKSVAVSVLTTLFVTLAAPLLVAYCRRPGLVVRFEVVPNKIMAGETAKLLWETRDASEVFIAPPRRQVESEGSLAVRPDSDTEYQIEVLNRFREARGSTAKLIVIPASQSTKSTTTTSTTATSLGGPPVGVTTTTARPSVELGVREYDGDLIYKDWGCEQTVQGEWTFRLPPNEKFVSATWQTLEVVSAKSYLLSPPIFDEQSRTIVARYSFTGLDRVAFLTCPAGGHARIRVRFVTREWP